MATKTRYNVLQQQWDFVNQGQQNGKNLGLYRMITHWKLAKPKVRFIIIVFYLHTYRLMHVAILCVAYLPTLV